MEPLAETLRRAIKNLEAQTEALKELLAQEEAKEAQNFNSLFDLCGRVYEDSI